LTGRLNRFLHWHDIRFFKNKGLLVYDLGGWYHGSDDKKKLAINAFKAEFGGVVAREYNCLLPVSLLGRVLCSVRWLLRRTNLRRGGL
jgi:lipid II:glycine glycyltransferase (peptidoglycan interpeptide bridge formation enzyme)